MYLYECIGGALDGEMYAIPNEELYLAIRDHESVHYYRYHEGYLWSLPLLRAIQGSVWYVGLERIELEQGLGIDF
tara:strand:+ start:21 stop:245 length:225 start_codon:yes stop_codon:yes gene_type:complete